MPAIQKKALPPSGRLFLFLLSLCCFSAAAQQPATTYWNAGTPLVSYRLPPPPPGYKSTYIDLDKDGDPDLLQTITHNNVPVQWVDDDDDMKITDLEGDTDNDCLMIDRNRDGKYGSFGDLIVDWVGGDGKKADLQVVVEYGVEKDRLKSWTGHYMWMIDTDGDNIFNYIDWNTFNLRAWLHNGEADFFKDYNGKTAFLKMHTSPEKVNDPRLNWENPFLFYDPDKDGLTEMAIRLCDSPTSLDGSQNPRDVTRFTGKIDWASIAVDMDNDNNVGRELDFDLTINFRGPGFDYMDQVHTFKNLRGLPEADTFFLDPRWRQLSELIYTDHDAAWNLVFNRGQWNQVYFTWDEDDDCLRWERVELYEPRSPFRIGAGNGGLDNHRQSDASGDRGEWDLDNSGNGRLYVGAFDGKVHLYGAEWGAWRIDQPALSFQGMGGIYENYGPGRTQTEPKKFATIRYEDTDNNGFADKVQYDLDGDTAFDHTVELKKLGLDDRAAIIDTRSLNYKGLVKVKKEAAERQWKHALQAVDVAHRAGLNTSWYALMMSPKSVREKSNYGYWLQFYIYFDLLDLARRTKNDSYIQQLDRAYYSGNWNALKNINIR